MNKIIFKTALKTLLAVLIALIVAFAVASLGFPASMATAFEKLGNYTFATGYASLAYTYSGKTEDLARCAEDSILSGEDGNIVNFCEKLIYDGSGNFEGLCKDKDEKSAIPGFSYRQYIYGNYSAALYRRGEKEKALNAADGAFDGVTGFPKNNAIAYLAIEVAKAQDAETAKKLSDRLSGITPAENEKDYYDTAKNILQHIS